MMPSVFSKFFYTKDDDKMVNFVWGSVFVMAMLALVLTIVGVLVSANDDQVMAVYYTFSTFICLWYTIIIGIQLHAVDQNEPEIFKKFVIVKTFLVIVSSSVLVFFGFIYQGYTNCVLPFFVSIFYMWICDAICIKKQYQLYPRNDNENLV